LPILAAAGVEMNEPMVARIHNEIKGRSAKASTRQSVGSIGWRRAPEAQKSGE
jgi:hypothetical protein